MKIGILTAGGDCPGLNAAIRGVGKTAIMKYGMRVIGFSSGYWGLIHQNYRELNEDDLSGILTMGGTILGTSREKPYKNDNYKKYQNNKPEKIIETYNELELDAVICIGGNGTMKTAFKLSQEGLNIIGIPKTIDNDVYGTDLSFGFDSAVRIATEAIDKIHTTANSHRRIMVIEVMGHNSGWLALYSGVAAGGDIILIPEIPYNEKAVENYLKKRMKSNKPYTIIVVAEGINIPRKKPEKKQKIQAGHYIAKRVAKITGMEARETILGYIQRGGSPTAMDRILATQFGSYAAELASLQEFGYMVALKDNKIKKIPLKDVAGKLKNVPMNDKLLLRARAIGTNFGDEIS